MHRIRVLSGIGVGVGVGLGDGWSGCRGIGIGVGVGIGIGVGWSGCRGIGGCHRRDGQWSVGQWSAGQWSDGQRRVPRVRWAQIRHINVRGDVLLQILEKLRLRAQDTRRGHRMYSASHARSLDFLRG